MDIMSNRISRIDLQLDKLQKAPACTLLSALLLLCQRLKRNKDGYLAPLGWVALCCFFKRSFVMWVYI